MRIKCPYCVHTKPDEPLSLSATLQLMESDDIVEDFIFQMRRLMELHNKRYGLKSYRGIGVHIGMKHKGMPNLPSYELNEQEKAALEKAEAVR